MSGQSASNISLFSARYVMDSPSDSSPIYHPIMWYIGFNQNTTMYETIPKEE